MNRSTIFVTGLVVASFLIGLMFAQIQRKSQTIWMTDIPDGVVISDSKIIRTEQGDKGAIVYLDLHLGFNCIEYRQGSVRKAGIIYLDYEMPGFQFGDLQGIQVCANADRLPPCEEGK